MLRLVILLQFFCINILLCKSEISSELVGVSVIFRHGDRTIISTYPNDPYKNSSFWPEGFGQLTNKGKMQQFELGQWLRKRYDSFLSNLYVRKDVYVLSTDLDRTLMSAESNLAGLFPPVRNQVWNSNLNWQPIPVHTIPQKFDNQLGMAKPCKKLNYLLAELLKTPTFLKIQEANQKLYSYLTDHSGYLINNLTYVDYLYDALEIETSKNYTLPEWTKTVFPSKLKPLAEFGFTLQTFTPELARFKVGTLFNKISHQFKNLMKEKQSATRYMVYSGHDTTIADVLNSLNLFEPPHCPPYTATILFELHKDVKSNHFVNIIYKNTTIPQKLTLQNCEFDCPIEKFFKIIEPLRLTTEQWENDCNDKYSVELLFSIRITSLACLLAVGLFLNLLAIRSVCRRRRKLKNLTFVDSPKNEKEILIT